MLYRGAPKYQVFILMGVKETCNGGAADDLF